MKIAIFTDIHEDFIMLEKAYNKLNSIGYDLLICLGDITGYTPEFYNHQPDANACIDLIRENADMVLAGNHDLYSCQRLPTYHLDKNIPENWYELTNEQQSIIAKDSIWLYENEIIPQLSLENYNFLCSLEEWSYDDTDDLQILFSHFVYPDLAGIGRWFPYQIKELKPHFKLMEELECQLAFVGHFHSEEVIIANKFFWSAPCIGTVKIKPKQRIILCPSIVGNGKSGRFTIFDTKTNKITPHHISKT